ncbi:hypothetical protein OK016_07540 [Vibrio chagasii]|nr:hypothetical protein [Vibrio chagasii]
MVERYGEDAYTSGMKVYTTVDSKLQKAANQAAIKNLLATIGVTATAVLKKSYGKPLNRQDHDKIVKHLKSQPTYGDLVPASSDCC